MIKIVKYTSGVPFDMRIWTRNGSVRDVKLKKKVYFKKFKKKIQNPRAWGLVQSGWELREIWENWRRVPIFVLRSSSLPGEEEENSQAILANLATNALFGPSRGGKGVMGSSPPGPQSKLVLLDIQVAMSVKKNCMEDVSIIPWKRQIKLSNPTPQQPFWMSMNP